MQVTKTLFQTKILNNAIRNFTFPDDLLERHQIIQRWINTLKAGTLAKVKETSLQGDFLKDLFQDILGYRSVISGEGKTWEIHAEQTISDGGGFADGALGLFTAVEGKSGNVKLCPVPREKLADINLTQYVQNEGYDVSWSRFTTEFWSLERPDVDALMKKIQRVGVHLKDFAGVKPYRGILTGLNEAFLIDNNTKNKIIQADPKSAEIIKPYLRGQDIKRWSPEWQNLWLILLKSSNDYLWLWSNASDEAENLFSQNFPSIHQYIKPLENKLRQRRDQGKYWWELRSCSYYHIVESKKIIYQEINTYPAYTVVCVIIIDGF